MRKPITTEDEARDTRAAVAMLAHALPCASEVSALDWLFIYGAFRRLCADLDTWQRAQSIEVL